jgi:ubiquinone/menaquinone biosynthesis C-methylase UbiE
MSYSEEMKSLQRFLDKNVRIYTAIEPRIEWLQKIEGTVLLLLKIKPKKMLLDASIGFGEFAIHAASSEKIRIVKLDLSKESLKITKNKIKKLSLQDRIYPVAGSVDFLPFKDSCFDGATLFYSLHHFYPAIVEKSLKEFNRVLKKRSRLVTVEDWAYEPRNEFQFLMLELRKIMLENEPKVPYRTYSSYIETIEKANLQIFSVEIYTRQAQLPTLEQLENKKAIKLIKKAKGFPEEEQVLDTVVIGAVKNK